MSQVIKFRAFYSGSMHYNIRAIKFSSGLLSRVDINHEQGDDSDSPDTWFGVLDKGVLMQFTGLIDKNGREVYVDDVFCWNGVNTVVYFDEDCPGYYIDLNGIPERLFKERMKYFGEVIGNIHDNPELLKAGTNER